MAQKRIEYYGRFTPTGVDTSQAKRLQALSGLAEQVGDIAFDIGAKIQTERGQEAGVASGMEAAQEGQAPETKEGFLSAISIYDQAYNKAALNAYSSGIRVDGKKKLFELEEQYADDPDPVAFQSDFNGYMKGVTEGLPEDIAADLRLRLTEDAMRVQGRLADAQRKRQFDLAAANLNEELVTLADEQARAARDGDDTRVQELQLQIENIGLENNEILDPAAYSKFTSEQEDRLIVQSNLGQLDRAILDNEDLSLQERIENGKQMLATVTANPIEGLTPEQQSKLESQMATRLNQLESRLVQEDTAFGIELSDYEVQVASGNIDPVDVDQQANEWYTTGRISQSEMTSLKKSARTAVAKKAETTAVNVNITKQFTDQRDPYYVPDQSDINKYYDDVYVPAQEGATPEQRMLTDAIFIQKTRMIPSTVKNQTNSYLLSGDPALIMQAAQLIDRVDETPGMFDQITNVQTKAFASNMVRLMEVMDPKEALRLSQQLTDPADQNRVTARRDQIKTEKYNDKYVDWTRDIVGEADPTSFQNAVSQYQTIFESYYLAGSDEDAARAQAEKMIQSNYTQSIFGDMMYAPEQYYAVNGSVEYMRDQLDEEIRAEAPNLQFDRDNIYLLTDDATARSAAAGSPMYRVLILDDDGVFQQRSGYFVPDVEGQQAKLRIETAELAAEIRQAEEEGSVAHRRQQFEEKRAAYEERKGKPRKAVPASELYADTVLSDSRRIVAEAIRLPGEIRREVAKSAAEVLTTVGERIEQTGKRQRSKLIEDIEEREAKD
jgi:Spy/CpxP family protein refolding chaperone